MIDECMIVFASHVSGAQSKLEKDIEETSCKIIRLTGSLQDDADSSKTRAHFRKKISSLHTKLRELVKRYCKGWKILPHIIIVIM